VEDTPEELEDVGAAGEEELWLEVLDSEAALLLEAELDSELEPELSLLAGLVSTPPAALAPPAAGLSCEPPRKSVTYQPEPFN
jgi:hypothetical protein